MVGVKGGPTYSRITKAEIKQMVLERSKIAAIESMHIACLVFQKKRRRGVLAFIILVMIKLSQAVFKLIWLEQKV